MLSIIPHRPDTDSQCRFLIISENGSHKHYTKSQQTEKNNPLCMVYFLCTDLAETSFLIHDYRLFD